MTDISHDRHYFVGECGQPETRQNKTPNISMK